MKLFFGFRKESYKLKVTGYSNSSMHSPVVGCNVAEVSLGKRMPPLQADQASSVEFPDSVSHENKPFSKA